MYFSDRFRRVMLLANQEAQRFSHEYIGVEHLLIAMLKDEVPACQVLYNLGVNCSKLLTDIRNMVSPGQGDLVIMGKLPMSAAAKQVFECAMEEARSVPSTTHVSTVHLLMGILRTDTGFRHSLNAMGVTLEKVRDEAKVLFGMVSAEDLDKVYGADASGVARQGDNEQIRLQDGQFRKKCLSWMDEMQGACTPSSPTPAEVFGSHPTELVRNTAKEVAFAETKMKAKCLSLLRGAMENLKEGKQIAAAANLLQVIKRIETEVEPTTACGVDDIHILRQEEDWKPEYLDEHKKRIKEVCGILHLSKKANVLFVFEPRLPSTPSGFVLDFKAMTVSVSGLEFEWKLKFREV